MTDFSRKKKKGLLVKKWKCSSPEFKENITQLTLPDVRRLTKGNLSVG